MKLQQIICDKFSIVLTMAMIFLALPAIAVAQHNSGALRNVGGDNTYTGGIYIAVGDLNSDATTLNLIYVSRISLLTGAFDGGVGVVDSCDPDAARKIRMLFDVRRNLRLTDDVVIEIPENNTPEWFQATNYLRQAQASGTRIPLMKLVVVDSSNQTGVEVKLENCLVSNYSISGAAGGDAHASALYGEGKTVTIAFVKTKK